MLDSTRGRLLVGVRSAWPGRGGLRRSGLIWRGVTLVVLVALWGAYAVIDGVLALIGAFRTSDNQRWTPLLRGAVSIAAGIATFMWPDLAALALVYIIAAWALITGVLEVITAVRLRQVIHNEWWMALSGVLSVVFGLAVIVFPGAGALALVWVIAAYAIVFGALLIALGFRLRGNAHRQPVGALA